VPGRIVVSIAVSVLYTYPFHTRYVFRVARLCEPVRERQP
jgi:hypothetical protein